MHLVLVHGAGGTPSTWSAVAPLLEQRGHAYTLVTNPMLSLDGDTRHTRAVVEAVGEPVLLVGHSYGGAVITNAGTAPSVRGLIYVAAFAPDSGESVQQIVDRYEPAEVSKYMERGPNGEWSTGRGGDFWSEIGWDLSEEHRLSLIEETRASSDEIFAQPTGEPAWRTRPSWYLVASGDKTLRPEIQRDMAARAGAASSEVDTSHFTPRVAPDRIVAVIETALEALS